MLKRIARAVHLLALPIGMALAGGCVVAAAAFGTRQSFAGHQATMAMGTRSMPIVAARKVQDPPSFTNYQAASESFPTVRNFHTKILLCPPSAPFVVGGGAQTMSPRTAVLTQSIPIAGPVPADG